MTPKWSLIFNLAGVKIGRLNLIRGILFPAAHTNLQTIASNYQVVGFPLGPGYNNKAPGQIRYHTFRLVCNVSVYLSRSRHGSDFIGLSDIEDRNNKTVCCVSW